VLFRSKGSWRRTKKAPHQFSINAPLPLPPKFHIHLYVGSVEQFSSSLRALGKPLYEADSVIIGCPLFSVFTFAYHFVADQEIEVCKIDPFPSFAKFAMNHVSSFLLVHLVASPSRAGSSCWCANSFLCDFECDYCLFVRWQFYLVNCKQESRTLNDTCHCSQRYSVIMFPYILESGVWIHLEDRFLWWLNKYEMCFMSCFILHWLVIRWVRFALSLSLIGCWSVRLIFFGLS
jgi:hypothetical protein